MTKTVKKDSVEKKEQTPEKVATAPETKTSFSEFVIDLASMIYRKTIFAKTTPWDSLDAQQKSGWCMTAEHALISLDQMNKEIVSKRDIKKEEYTRNKNVDILKTIIDNFIAGLTALKCPECGKTRKIRMGLFPSEELAHKILDVDTK